MAVANANKRAEIIKNLTLKPFCIFLLFTTWKFKIGYYSYVQPARAAGNILIAHSASCGWTRQKTMEAREASGMNCRCHMSPLRGSPQPFHLLTHSWRCGLLKCRRLRRLIDSRVRIRSNPEPLWQWPSLYQVFRRRYLRHD